MSTPLTMTYNGKYLILMGRISARVHDVARMLPGRKKWRQSDGSLWMEPTSGNIECIRDNLPLLTWDDTARPLLEAVTKIRDMENGILRELDSITSSDFQFKTKPYDHQIKAFEVSKDREAFGYFMEMGTGKSKVIVDNVAYLYLEKKISNFLVITYNGVHRQWIEEQIPTHLLDNIPVDLCLYEASKRDWVEEKLERMSKKTGCLRVLAMNIEALSKKDTFDIAIRFAKSGKTLGAIDESTKIKNPSANRSKNAWALANYLDYRRIASGSPITKSPLDAYSQFKFLDPRILGYSSFYPFRNRYAVMGGWENKKVVAYQNLEELQRRIHGHSYRVLKEDCLDLPERVYMTRDVEFVPEQAAVYQSIRDDFITELKSGGVIEAPLAIQRLVRMQQILCGYLPDPENPGSFEEIPTNRPQALLDVLEEIPDDAKTIVWFRYHYDADRIGTELDRAGIKYVRYDGTVSEKQRAENLRLFKTDPSVRVFLGNPASGGVGLNLTEANYVVWYAQSFDLEQYLQANDRVHRIGQKKNVTVIILTTPGSIDIKIASSLQQKKRLADMILDNNEMMQLLAA